MKSLRVIKYQPKGVRFFYLGDEYAPLVDPRMLNPLDIFVEWSLSFGYWRIDTLGVYNRRKIAGSWRWSAHAWARGFDLVGVWDSRGRGFKYGNEDDRRLMAGALKFSGFTVQHLSDCKGKYNHLHAQVPYSSLITPPTKLEVIR